MGESTGRFSRNVEDVLKQAGWFPGRAVSDEELDPWCAFSWQGESGYCHAFPAAYRVLREFGGLVVEQELPGITCLRESFSTDPLSALGIDDHNWIFNQWDVDDVLFPLGWIGEQKDRVLAITPRGRVYGFGYIPCLYGDTFDQAIDNLIIGIKPLQLIIHNSDLKGREAGQVKEAVQRLF
jgi:hypothetical protein